MSNNNLTPPERYDNTQSSGYDTMSDPFYYDFPSTQEMGPPPLPNRFQQQQQQPQHMQPQPMDHSHAQMADNQQQQHWQQPQKQPQHQNTQQQYQSMPQQQQQQQPSQQYERPSQHLSQEIQQFQSPQSQFIQSQSVQQSPSQPIQQPESVKQEAPQESEPSQFHQPPPSQPTFRFAQPPSASQSSTSQASQKPATPQFLINNQAATSSRSNTPVLADKTRINVLRQQVLHPVDPKIAEKMHTGAVSKPRDNVAEVLTRMKDYESVIPDATAKYVMSRSGTVVDDDICYRMLAISAQKFASDILSDAITIARSRGLGQTNRATKETKYVLSQELLKEVLSEHGIKTIHHS